MAKIDAGAKRSIGIMAVIIGVSVVAVIGFVVYMKATMNNAGSTAVVPVAGDEERKPMAGSDTDYNDKLKAADVDAAKRAKNEGKTYIPISSGTEEDVGAPANGAATSSHGGMTVSGPGASAVQAATQTPALTPAPSMAATAPGVTGTIDARVVPAKPKTGDVALPTFPADPNVPTPPPAPRTAQNDGQQGQPGQPQTGGDQRSAVLDQIYSQDENKRRAEITQKRMEAKMQRINQVAEYLAKNEEYSPIKASGSWIKPATTVAPVATVSAPVQTAGATQDGAMIIKTGEKVYVNIETATDSDEPSNVFGQIMSGKARGWVIFGKATQNPNFTVSIVFDTLALPDGKSAKINAMAIDPNTGRTSIQGSVDHKIFERFVLPMVAGGLGAYGDLMSKQGQTMSINPLTGAPMAITNNMDMSQIRNAAIGSGVKSVTANITKSSEGAKPSTSTKRNLGIEVIFMQEVIMQ